MARISREGGARVSTNVMVRDLDLSQAPGVDGRRLEVVAEGLSLFGGAQLANDATLVSALHVMGLPGGEKAERTDIPRTGWQRGGGGGAPEPVEGQR